MTWRTWVGLLFAMWFFSLYLQYGEAQSAPVQGGQAQPLQMDGHPQQAAPHALGTEHSLLTGGVSIAQGEQSLSNYPSGPVPFVALGTVAREYREGHIVPRAKLVWMPWE